MEEGEARKGKGGDSGRELRGDVLNVQSTKLKIEKVNNDDHDDHHCPVNKRKAR